MLSLQSLLNPIANDSDTPSSESLLPRSPAKENVRPQLEALTKLSSLAFMRQITPLAPPSIKNALDLAVTYFGDSGSSQSAPSTQHFNPRLHPSNPARQSPSSDTWIQYNVEINRQTTLERVIFHPADSLVEYPETSTSGKIGHLFTIDPLQWVNPVHNFAYSLGGSRGMSPKDKPVKVSLLVDESGEMVPCRVSHSTCKFAVNF
jgi:hypothetical protein